MAASRIGVVGAGLAGLSAALELKQRGFEVDLFERSRLLGGKATSFAVGGVEVDNGQHVYLACCTEFIDFACQLGNGTAHDGNTLYLQDRFDALLLSKNRPAARLRAVALPAPLHLLPALVRYRYLTPLDRLRVALALLDAGKPARPGETFAAWLTRHHQGTRAREAFWDPFLIPALNAPLEEVAAEAALFVIATAFLTDAGAGRFGYARVPLGRLAEAASAQVDHVYRRTPITRLEVEGESGMDTPSPGGAASPSSTANVRLGTADGGRFTYDAVVLAVPPANLQRLLHDSQRPGSRAEDFGVHGLDRFQTAPIVDVHLWYDPADLATSRSGGARAASPIPNHGSSFGFGFAALIDSPVQWVFEKGPGYLCCSMSAANEYIGLPNAALIDLCHHEIVRVLPVISGSPIKGAVTRDREATFIPSPGLHRPGNATTCSRVVIAGAWTDTGWPATMESAVRSGRSAARLIASQVGQRN